MLGNTRSVREPVGIIIGAVYGSIITSLIFDIIMPPLGSLLGTNTYENVIISSTDICELYREEAAFIDRPVTLEIPHFPKRCLVEPFRLIVRNPSENPSAWRAACIALPDDRVV